MTDLMIGRRRIGHGRPCYVIAEIGVNHNGNMAIAKKLIDKAKWAGADAVKFQSFTASSLVSIKDKSFEKIRELELSRNDHVMLAKYCKKIGIVFLSSAFDKEMVDLLEDLCVPAHKIASCELTNLSFLKYAAAKNKPLLVSTGLSSYDEIKEAVGLICRTGNRKFILLHCVSIYPPKPECTNLKTIEFLRKEFGVPVGFSDHSVGNALSVAAIALGACVIERHFTLDKNLPGFDHKASLEPAEFKSMINDIRDVEKALGRPGKFISTDEKAMAGIMRNSIVADKDIKNGERIKACALSVKRPGTGIPPKYLDRLVGKRVRRAISAGDVIRFKDVIR